jgi:hypothetical protein
MAPRLDVTGKHRTFNRLIGQSLIIEQPDSSGFCTLILHTPLPAPGEDKADSLRAFHYEPGLRGFLPDLSN